MAAANLGSCLRIPGLVVLVEFAGGAVHTSHWLLDTSVFFHMVPAPATSPDWPSMAVITGLGILGAILGGILLCRRDQQSA